MATTLSPLAASSCARIDPVQPSPTITASVAGSLNAMTARLRSESLFRYPVGSAHDADGRQRVAFVVALDPIPVVVAGSGKSDHLPANHVAVAAVNGIGEEPLAGVLQQVLEEF